MGHLALTDRYNIALNIGGNLWYLYAPEGLYPQGGDSAWYLLKNAYIYIYAKLPGKNSHQFTCGLLQKDNRVSSNCSKWFLMEYTQNSFTFTSCEIDICMNDKHQVVVSTTPKLLRSFEIIITRQIQLNFYRQGKKY